MGLKNLYYFLIIAVFLAIVGFLIYSRGEIKYVKLVGQNIKVELATTPEEQARGLSARQGLAEGEGMLFVFPHPDKYLFWMKDMKFAIDIIWLDSGGYVVYVQKNAKPESYPDTFGPSKPAKYVLEVISGFSEKNSLKEGDMAELVY